MILSEADWPPRDIRLNDRDEIIVNTMVRTAVNKIMRSESIRRSVYIGVAPLEGQDTIQITPSSLSVSQQIGSIQNQPPASTSRATQFHGKAYTSSGNSRTAYEMGMHSSNERLSTAGGNEGLPNDNHMRGQQFARSQSSQHPLHSTSSGIVLSDQDWEFMSELSTPPVYATAQFSNRLNQQSRQTMFLAPSPGFVDRYDSPCANMAQGQSGHYPFAQQLSRNMVEFAGTISSPPSNLINGLASFDPRVRNPHPHMAAQGIPTSLAQEFRLQRQPVYTPVMHQAHMFGDYAMPSGTSQPVHDQTLYVNPPDICSKHGAPRVQFGDGLTYMCGCTIHVIF